MKRRWLWDWEQVVTSTEMSILEERKKTGLKEGMDSFLQLIGDEEKEKKSKLHRAWEILASEKVLEHTDSIRYQKRERGTGILVFLDDPVWVAECDMSRDSYRILLTQWLDEKVDEVRFFLTKDKKFKSSFQKRDSKGNVVEKGNEGDEGEPYLLGKGIIGEVSSREMRKIQRRCGFIEDENLRESVSKAMKSNLEWKKGQETAKRR